MGSNIRRFPTLCFKKIINIDYKENGKKGNHMNTSALFGISGSASTFNKEIYITIYSKLIYVSLRYKRSIITQILFFVFINVIYFGHVCLQIRCWARPRISTYKDFEHLELTTNGSSMIAHPLHIYRWIQSRWPRTIRSIWQWIWAFLLQADGMMKMVWKTMLLSVSRDQ